MTEQGFIPRNGYISNNFPDGLNKEGKQVYMAEVEDVVM